MPVLTSSNRYEGTCPGRTRFFEEGPAGGQTCSYPLYPSPKKHAQQKSPPPRDWHIPGRRGRSRCMVRADITLSPFKGNRAALNREFSSLKGSNFNGCFNAIQALKRVHTSVKGAGICASIHRGYIEGLEILTTHKIYSIARGGNLSGGTCPCTNKSSSFTIISAISLPV